MEERKEYRIGELYNVQNGLSKGGEFFGTGYPFVSFKTVFNNYFLPVSILDLAETSEVDRIKYSVKRGDILITRTSETAEELGMSCVALSDMPNATYNGFCKRLRPCHNDIVLPEYIGYLFRSKAIRSIFNSLSSMTTRASLRNDDLLGIKLSLPTINEQKKVASILRTIDTKIELNRRINDNLEQQAQALFKSWFVDNSNPNWEETSLSEVASFVGGYSYTGEELTDCSNIAMATIKNFGRNGGFKADGFKEINPSAKLKECHYANLFDILVAHTDLTQNADVIGNAELLLTYGKYNSIIFSMDLVKVLPKETFPYRFLLAAMLKNKLFKGHSLGYVNGTTVLHLSKKALPDFEIRKPSDSESKMMDEVLASYYKRMAELLQENDRLISLRDTLIPKLMSGKLKINDLNC